MTTITAREIFLEYVTRLNGNGPMPNYVTVEEYEAMVHNFAEKVHLIAQETEALKSELATTEALLNERQRLLDAIPECEAHGPCVPHALNWIATVKAIPQRWQELGHVQADNTEDSNSQLSIKFGFVAGEGLLGNVLLSGMKMASIANNYGYSGLEDDGNKWENARVEFYNSVKAIEQLIADTQAAIGEMK